MIKHQVTLFRKYYTYSLVVIANVIILFFVLNVFLFNEEPASHSLSVQDQRAALKAFPLDMLSTLYPSMPMNELKDSIFTNAEINFSFDPFPIVQNLSGIFKSPRAELVRELDKVERRAFMDQPFSKQNFIWYGYHEQGFRFIEGEQGPWPPDPDSLNVFVFGGSAAMGEGASGNETISAYLQAMFREQFPGKEIYTYNFGTGGHFSVQERAYLEKFLLDGIHPDVAIFVDGILEFFNPTGEPGISDQIRAIFKEKWGPNVPVGFSFRLKKLFDEIPIIKWIRDNKDKKEQIDQQSKREDIDGPHWGKVYKEILERYIRNKSLIEAVSASTGVVPVFVWQPISLYKYDGPPSVPNFHYTLYRAEAGYPLARTLFDAHPMGKNFLWCADIQKNLSQPMYVDGAHYSPFGAKLTAQCIFNKMAQQGILNQIKALVDK